MPTFSKPHAALPLLVVALCSMIFQAISLPQSISSELLHSSESEHDEDRFGPPAFLGNDVERMAESRTVIEDLGLVSQKTRDMLQNTSSLMHFYNAVREVRQVPVEIHLYSHVYPESADVLREISHYWMQQRIRKRYTSKYKYNPNETLDLAMEAFEEYLLSVTMSSFAKTNKVANLIEEMDAKQQLDRPYREYYMDYFHIDYEHTQLRQAFQWLFAGSNALIEIGNWIESGDKSEKLSLKVLNGTRTEFMRYTTNDRFMPKFVDTMLALAVSS